MLKFIYSLFLGLLLAVFVGMGVATFYPGPQAPQYPKELREPLAPDKDYTAEQKRAQTEYDNRMERFTKDDQAYSRNVSMIVLGAAVLLLVVGLLLEVRAPIFADGLLLGGILTLLYSIIRSFMAAQPKYSFAVVTVGLIATISVGYFKFVKPLGLAQKK